MAAAGICLFAAQALPGAMANAAPASHGVRPNAMGNLDCNGFSPIQRPLKQHAVLHRHPRLQDHYERFYDNGHYIGHDEPSIRFLSNRPGSGNNVTFTETLPRDPAALPRPTIRPRCLPLVRTVPRAVVRDEHLRPPAPSRRPKCTPNSDNNAPHGTFPGGGAAFMEMQFYPPGFAPFSDSIQLQQHPLVRGAQHRFARGHRPQRPRTRAARSRSTSPSSSATACPPGRPARSSPTGRRSRPTARR